MIGILLFALLFRESETFGADFLCSRIPGLNARQRDICQNSPDALVAIGEGTKLALSECQHQFRLNRWNCTIVGSEIYGHVLVLGTKEAAFLYAISSAGVTYAITQSCARGNISTCGCAPPTTISTTSSPSPDWGVASGWRWGGCSADVDYAVRLSRKFLDSREIEGDERAKMNLHNNRAGRKAVKSTLETECKCHGVSGSCTLRTCWLKLATFRKIGEKLLLKYKRAKISSKKRSELSYMDPSPNYCDYNETVGSLGTRNRQCVKRDKDNNCDILCCGRGYNTHQINRKWKCHCKFRWCCEVVCQDCSELVEVYTCN